MSLPGRVVPGAGRGAPPGQAGWDTSPVVPYFPLRCGPVGGQKSESCSGGAFVGVVQASEDRPSDHLPVGRPMPRDRGLQTDGSMGSVLVVIGHELGQHRSDMPLAQRQDVVQALATVGSAQPVPRWRSPGAPERVCGRSRCRARRGGRRSRRRRRDRGRGSGTWGAGPRAWRRSSGARPRRRSGGRSR